MKRTFIFLLIMALYVGSTYGQAPSFTSTGTHRSELRILSADSLNHSNQISIAYPIALRSNLLYDAIGGLNIGVEFPLGKKKNWSMIADIAYADWRSPNQLYALQTLEYGVEARYWFGVPKERKIKHNEWSKPLRGWNIGVYGAYGQHYDVQWIDGFQGNSFWSAGVTAGYSFPFARNFTFEAGIGVGYFYTPEYRHYHRPEYDNNGTPHLMWQETGSFGSFTLTKLRFTIVWLLPIKKGETKK